MQFGEIDYATIGERINSKRPTSVEELNEILSECTGGKLDVVCWEPFGNGSFILIYAACNVPP